MIAQQPDLSIQKDLRGFGLFFPCTGIWSLTLKFQAQFKTQLIDNGCIALMGKFKGGRGGSQRRNLYSWYSKFMTMLNVLERPWIPLLASPTCVKVLVTSPPHAQEMPGDMSPCIRQRIRVLVMAICNANKIFKISLVYCSLCMNSLRKI